MANIVERSILQSMIEDKEIDIPYDSKGFMAWLQSSLKMTEKQAAAQIELIREEYLDTWDGETDLFSLLEEYLDKAEKESERMSGMPEEIAGKAGEEHWNVYHEIIVDSIAREINYLISIQEDQDEAYLPLLFQIINAYRLYLRFMEDKLGCEATVVLNEFDHWTVLPKRYRRVPLDAEFKKYLDASKYPPRTRDKMMSNLRKFNELVIDNGRGDSNWLEKTVRESEEGRNLNSKRLHADRLFHHALAYLRDYGIDEEALRGGFTTLNAYIRFLIHRQKNPQKNTTPC